MQSSYGCQLYSRLQLESRFRFIRLLDIGDNAGLTVTTPVHINLIGDSCTKADYMEPGRLRFSSRYVFPLRRSIGTGVSVRVSIYGD
jgi:hypothetical protein